MSKGMNKNTKTETIQAVGGANADIAWNTKEKRQLIEAILALKNPNEVRYFLRDLLTKEEIEEFAARLQAASLLLADTQYNAITEATGLSSATIARISKWLYGPLGGYRLVLPRLSKHHYNSSQLRKGLSLSS